MLTHYPIVFLISFTSIILSSTKIPLAIRAQKTEDCIRHCGYLDHIPWPFGIGDNCFIHESFAVTCNYSSSSSSYVPLLKNLNLQILDIRFVNGPKFGDLIVKIPSFFSCGDNSSGYKSRGPNLGGSFFSFSSKNVFASVGCDGYAMMMGGDSGRVVTGCSSVCDPDLPSKGLNGEEGSCGGFGCCQRKIRSPVKNYTVDVRVDSGSNGCRSAFLIGKEFLENAQVSNSSKTTSPVVLEWSILDAGLDEANEYSRLKHVLTIAILYVFLPSIGTLLLTYATFRFFSSFLTRKARKEVKLRTKYFKIRLDEKRGTDREAVETIKLFTMKELNIITNNFAINGVLGQGGQGVVYKGMLSNGQVVAVKRSRKFDKTQWMQFINEVILLSQIKHRHVVKLLGCCLETKEPMVVYEFISNGTLFDHIHKPSEEFVLSWKIRVRIASEIADAITYLHLDSPNPIYHRDIKSSNILLDDAYTAKLSDFGISKAVSVDQTHLTTSVQGTLGYLDPEYFMYSQFSEKSDVYSFGAVLLELLTGQTPSHLVTTVEEGEEKESMVEYFMSLIMSDSTLYKALDPIVLESNEEDEVMVVARLAGQCLNPRGVLRPTMKEVAMVLDGLKNKNDPGNCQEMENGSISHKESENGYSICSTSMSINIWSPFSTR